MSVDPTPGPVKVAARERKRSRNRVGHYLFVILGSGAIAALIALLIAFIPTVIAFAFPAGSGLQINAADAFPSVSPTHQVVNVYDPAPKSRPTAPPAEPPERETPPPLEPTDSPTAQPTESPEPGDH